MCAGGVVQSYVAMRSRAVFSSTHADDKSDYFWDVVCSHARGPTMTICALLCFYASASKRAGTVVYKHLYANLACYRVCARKEVLFAWLALDVLARL